MRSRDGAPEVPGPRRSEAEGEERAPARGVVAGVLAEWSRRAREEEPGDREPEDTQAEDEEARALVERAGEGAERHGGDPRLAGLLASSLLEELRSGDPETPAEARLDGLGHAFREVLRCLSDEEGASAAALLEGLLAELRRLLEEEPEDERGAGLRLVIGALERTAARGVLVRGHAGAIGAYVGPDLRASFLAAADATWELLTGSHGGRQAAMREGALPMAKPPHADEEPALLMWNTLFPESPQIARTRELFAGEEQLLRTLLEPRLDPDALLAEGIHPDDVAGKAIYFELEGKNLLFREEGGSSSPSLRSAPRPCDRSGCAAFEAWVMAPEAGPAELRLLLWAMDLDPSSRSCPSFLSSRRVELRALPRALPREPEEETEAETEEETEARAEPTRLSSAIGARLRERRPPSLCLRLRRAGERYELRAHSSEAHDASFTPVMTWKAREVDKGMARLRNELVALSGAYRASKAQGAGPFAIEEAEEEGEALLVRMAAIGMELHELLFGHPEEQGLHRQLAPTARLLAAQGWGAERPRLVIESEEHPFPWGVLYDARWRAVDLPEGDPERARRMRPPCTLAEVDLRAFWGARFDLDRVLLIDDPGDPEAIGASLRVRSFVDDTIDQQQSAQGIHVIDKQLALFSELKGGGSPIEHAGAATTKAELRGFLESGEGAELLYFFCHANAAQTFDVRVREGGEDPERTARIELHGATATVAELREWRRKPLPGRPLVFMNACSTAQGDDAYPSLFLRQFEERWAARGFLGTDWKVPTAFADAFARAFLRRLLAEGQSVGEALRETAEEAFLENNPFPLIYALFCHPELTMRPETPHDARLRDQ